MGLNEVEDRFLWTATARVNTISLVNEHLSLKQESVHVCTLQNTIGQYRKMFLGRLNQLKMCPVALLALAD